MKGRHPAYRPELRDEVTRLYRRHHSLAKVAAEMGISRTRVRDLLIEVGMLPEKRDDEKDAA